MKVTQEQFDKLKQLDRIEYRQKARNIEEWNEGSLGWVGLRGIFFVCIFLFLIIPQGYSVWGIEFVEDISSASFTLISIFSMIAFFGFILDVAFMIFRSKNLKELQERYFKIEVKK